MAAFIVSYDLRKQGRDYQTLYDRLKQWKAVSILESVWLIRWDATSSQIRDDLKKYIDANDALFVAKLTGQAAWTDDLLSPSSTVKSLLEG